MHEYMGTGNVTPRASSASSPRLTSVMMAGASRGNASRPHFGHRIDRSATDRSVGVPQRPQ